MYYYKNFVNKIPDNSFLEFIINNYHSNNYRLDYNIKDFHYYLKNCMWFHASFCINSENEIIGSVIITRYPYKNSIINYINFACIRQDCRNKNILLDILNEITKEKQESISGYIQNANKSIGNIIFNTQIPVKNITPIHSFNFVYTGMISGKPEIQIKQIKCKDITFLKNRDISYDYDNFYRFSFLEAQNKQIICYNLNFIDKDGKKQKNIYITESSELLSEKDIVSITYFFRIKGFQHITFISTLLNKKGLEIKDLVISKPNYIYSDIQDLNNFIIF
jgi:hypothetical protein